MRDAQGAGRDADAFMTRYGVPIDRALRRREERAARFGAAWGSERVHPGLIDALAEVVPVGASVLEVGAAAGALTAPLLANARTLGIAEASPTFRRILAEGPLAAHAIPVRIYEYVDDVVSSGDRYEVAVVTFTMRHGIGILTLMDELAGVATDRIVVVLDDDGSFAWAHLARAAAIQGFDVHLGFVVDEADTDRLARRRSVVIVATVPHAPLAVSPESAWESEARSLTVPHPAPRGTATRLVRYFLASGDPAVMIRCDQRDIERLYGNLRTAAHRLAFEEVAVRRMDDGVQLVRLPRTSD